MPMTREVYTKKFPEKIIGEDDTNQKITACMSCGLSLESTSVFKSIQEEKVDSKIQVLEENEIQTLPIEKENCSKCGNEEAYSWQRQTRSGDEPATRFYRCVKCEHTWREYS